MAALFTVRSSRVGSVGHDFAGFALRDSGKFK
jgi:hypothetical protein